jgi:hypothetical protein
MFQVAQKLDTSTEQIINAVTFPAQIPSRVYEYLSGNNILLNAPLEAGLGVVAATGIGCLVGDLIQRGIKQSRKINSPLEL